MIRDESTGATAGTTHESPWLEVDQARVDAFADLTGDHNPLHVDPVWASEHSPYKATIAHGFLTLSLVPQLARGLFTLQPGTVAVNYGLDRVRFVAPVKVGTRIRGLFAVTRSELRKAGTMMHVGVEIEVEGSDRRALVADWLVFLTQTS